jgi:hypothetical protein
MALIINAYMVTGILRLPKPGIKKYNKKMA